MILKILNTILILIAVFMGTKHGWNMLTAKPEMTEIFGKENDGKGIYGNFYAGQWGTFRVHFKFHQNNLRKRDYLLKGLRLTTP